MGVIVIDCGVCHKGGGGLSGGRSAGSEFACFFFGFVSLGAIVFENWTRSMIGVFGNRTIHTLFSVGLGGGLFVDWLFVDRLFVDWLFFGWLFAG